MSWLFEQPMTIAVLAVIVVTLLGFVWVQTGRREALAAVAVALLIFLGLLVAERVVVTDREALDGTVRQLGRDVAKNDRTLLYPYIASSAPQLKQKADTELPSYEFSECVITKVDAIEIDAAKNPPEAKVKFIVRVAGTFRYQGDSVSGGPFLRYVTLHFVKEPDGRWRVKDYEHADVQEAWLKPGK